MTINLNHALNLRSDFSLGESMLQIKPMIERAKELGYESVALTDVMSVSAMVEFTNQAKKAGMKPIIGATLRVYDDPTWQKEKGVDGPKKTSEVRLRCFVQNETGLNNLIRVLSLAYSKERFYYNARCGWDDLLSLEGCALTTGDFMGLMHHPDGPAIAKRLHHAGRTLYAEIVPINTPLFDRLNERVIRTAAALGLPSLVTYPVLYRDAEDAPTLDVLRGIRENVTLDKRWLPQQFVRDLYLKGPRVMLPEVAALSRRLDGLGINASYHLTQGLGNIDALAYSVSYEFTKLPPCLPQMAPGGAAGEFIALKTVCTDNFKERLGRPILGYQANLHRPIGHYIERLKYELAVIEKMGFSGYFLLVHDIVHHAKQDGIMVGPGRGSVGGSLVAYLMGITDVDPLRFDLLFERFINPERVDLPDADLDFMSGRRHEVIDYIINRYGRDNVAGISNFSTLQAAGALRDVSRIHGLMPFDYTCSKLMETEHGQSKSLDESAKTVPDIEKFRDARPVIWNHAVRLEGCMRNLGQHAAGVVIADRPVRERAVIETRNGGQLPLVNWDKKYVEDWGLIKIDVLGISTLDMLDLAKTYIRQRTKTEIDYLAIPLDDAKVLDAFGRGDTTGVFQFQSSGMRKLLTELALGGALTFDDLVAVVALFRPGPLDAGACDEYIQIKQGARTPYYEHANLSPALEPTLGVMIYQEQVMRICRDLCGFTFAEADHVRKAMGKKDADKMAEWKDRFVGGALSVSGMDNYAATTLWEKIEGFSSYGFNKSHAVEYGVISYWTMWLKVHHPAEFFAACMSIQDKDDKLAPLVMDAKTKGITVRPPDINRSSTRIEIHGTEVYAPFQAIKGISETVGAAIVELREKTASGWFNKPADLDPDKQKAIFPRVIINAAHREKLARVGALWTLDTTGPDPMHVDRLKDRLELMPGYTVEAVRAERVISSDRAVQLELLSMIGKHRDCEGCSLKGTPHALPRLGKTPKFMVVFDSPSLDETRAGRMLEGDGASYLKAALADAGLSANDGYYTSMIKAAKRGKGIANEQIIGCTPHLKAEIALLKPPVILVLGTQAFKHFCPELKGSATDFVGKTKWDADLDASIVVGINPLQVFFDPSKVSLLQQACQQVAELVK